jgi:hypothetical protein
MVRAPHQFSALFKVNSSTPFVFFDSSTIITAHDDKFLVQSVEPAAFIAGGFDIARSAPHTLLNQRDGLFTYLMAVFAFSFSLNSICFSPFFRRTLSFMVAITRGRWEPLIQMHGFVVVVRTL